MTDTLHILHLEDEPNDAALVRAILEEDGLGFDVSVVSSREAFAEALGREGIDLILSDFNLPSFDGLSALALARKARPRVPFIFVSGRLGEDAAIESLRNGATDYVLKTRLSRLAPAVRRALEESDQRRRRASAEEALEIEQQFLRALLESLEVGIVACDARYELTLFNRAARELHGVPADAPAPNAGSQHYQLFHPDGRTALEPHAIPLFRALQGEPIRNVEIVIVPGQGVPRTVLTSGQPIFDASGRKLGAVVAMHDITDRKQLEEQFRQAQKMEAVGRLAGGVAHDFNNLLTVILGYSQLLGEKLRPGDALRGDVGEIEKAATRAASLTRQLLAFSRRQVLLPRVLDLNAVIADMETMLRRLIGSDLELRTSGADELWHVKADPGQIEQVIVNLVVNARDAMPGGGTLTISTANVQLAAGAPSRATEPGPGAYVRLDVTDTGCGMDAEVRSRIFEPFFTTKGERGTGLGLSTVHGIVRQSGGHIEVESEPGQGCRVRIHLPRAEEALSRLEGHAPAGPVARGDEAILVVEDEEQVRGVMAHVLRSAGYTVVEAADREAALRACEASERDEIAFDLMVSDVVMPGMSVTELATRLARVQPGMRLLYTSGYMDKAMLVRRELDASIGLLQKPFTPAALLQKVREALDEPTRRAA